MNVLAMVAHPDDETLGAGGTLAKHAKAGDKVSMAYLTDGVGARGSSVGSEKREKAAMRAASALGIGWVEPHRLYPDNQLDSIPFLNIAKAVERYINALRPEVIYTHHAGDLNIDHRICNQAVLTACRPMKDSTIKGIYAMEIPSSTEWQVPNSFQPNMFVDISDTFNEKRDAILCYDEEMREFPHPRSFNAINSLAIWRGASVGLWKAEAFMVLREIV